MSDSQDIKDNVANYKTMADRDGSDVLLNPLNPTKETETEKIVLKQNDGKCELDQANVTYVGSGEKLTSLTIKHGPVVIENVTLQGPVYMPFEGRVTFNNVQFGDSASFIMTPFQPPPLKEEEEEQHAWWGNLVTKYVKFEKPAPDSGCCAWFCGYFKIFFSLFLICNIWLLIGAACFQAAEGPQYDDLVSDCNAGTGNVTQLECAESLALNWLQDEWENPWTFYNSYLFSYSISCTVGFWNFEVVTGGGEWLVFLWGVPAMTIGIATSLVLAHLMYLMVMDPLIHRYNILDSCVTKGPWKSRGSNKYLMMLLINLLFVFILWQFKDAFLNDEPSISGSDKLFFLYTWLTTLGVSEANTYFLLGNPNGNFMLYLIHQILFVNMAVLIGTAIKLLDDMGDILSTNLGLDKFIELDLDEKDKDKVSLL